MDKRVGFYIPILYKLIALALFTMVLPLVIASQWLYGTSLETIDQLQNNNAVSTLTSMTQSVDYRLRKMDQHQITIYDNLEFRNLLPLDKQMNLTTANLNAIKDILMSSVRDSDYGTCLSILFDSGQTVSYYLSNVVDIRFLRLQLEWFSSQNLRDYATALDGRCFWLPSIKAYKQVATLQPEVQSAFFFVRSLRNPDYKMADVGIMIQAVNTSFFNESITNALPPNWRVLVVSADRSIVWDSEQSYTAMQISAIPELSSLDLDNPSTVFHSSEGIDYQVYHHVSSYNEWMYYMLIPVKTITAVAQPIRTLTAIMWASAILILILGFFVYRMLVSRPLKTLIVKMNTLVPGQEPSITFDIKRNDEIAVLYRSFHNMIMRIQLLMRQLNISHERQIQQEIQLLQAQLNPHFLYNTLDSINWLAKEHDVTDICNLIQALSEILHYLLRKQITDVKLSDELHMVQNYIFIQQYRFKNKFHIEYHIDEQVLCARVDRLLIQPIVENAVNHGLANHKEHGLIELSISKIGLDVHVSVRDNGCGMSEDLVTDVFMGKVEGIGLFNIHRYVQQKYGSSYGLTIQSVLGEGTTVILLLPFKT